MQTIVITGSTRGIGYALAREFLALGCNVVVSGRAQDSLDLVVADLSARHPPERILGVLCDVTRFGDVQGLWESAQTRFGRVDIWINNAGLGTCQTPFHEHPPEEIRTLIETNVIGAMYGCKVALAGMLAQGHGAIYNLEGLGSDGRKIEGLTLYGASKYALTYLTDALARQTRNTGVLVGAIRPGMLLTRLVTQQYIDNPEQWQRDKHVISILADGVETVIPWLAPRILSNRRNGARIVWLTSARAGARFVRALFQRPPEPKMC